jgi:hypothetical protein
VTIAFFALMGFIFLVTQYFQFVKSFSALGAGVRLLPVAGPSRSRPGSARGSRSASATRPSSAPG